MNDEKTKTRISQETRDLLRILPGYDPFDQAEGYIFDESAGFGSINWIERYCTFSQGAKAGQTFILEPWQKSIIANLFGWKRNDEQGLRRFRESLIFVPRKNGKSELAAAITCCILFCDPEPGSQLFSVAAKRDQAKYIFDPVCKMIRNNPELNSRSSVYKYSVICQDRSYRTITSDANTEHGGSTQYAVIDELHAQPNRELVDVIQTSMGSRRQPLLIYTTTSDFDREGSICNKTHDYGKKICDGIIDDPQFLPVIYEATVEDDWTSEKVWESANPNLGISLSRDFLRNQCRRAEEEKGFENTFKRLHLNVRTEQAFRWIKMDQWDACNEPFEESSLNGKKCYGGLDLATVNDMAALVLVFPEGDTYMTLCHFWCPQESAIQRERKDRQPYVTWSDQGFVQLTPGNVIDYTFIRAKINELGHKYQIQEIAFDPYNATMLATELGEKDGFQMLQFRQGFLSMNEPCKFLESLVMSKRLRHNGNPVLRWNASNVCAVTDASDNIKMDKKTSNEKIDGMVALAMALGRAMANKDSSGSVYEKRGLVVI